MKNINYRKLQGSICSYANVGMHDDILCCMEAELYATWYDENEATIQMIMHENFLLFIYIRWKGTDLSH